MYIYIIDKKSFHCYTANYYQTMPIFRLMIYSFKKVIHKIKEFYPTFFRDAHFRPIIQAFLRDAMQKMLYKYSGEAHCMAE